MRKNKILCEVGFFLVLVICGFTTPLRAQEIIPREYFNFNLVYPFDESTITEKRPVLSWQSLHESLSVPGGIDYNLLLVKLRPGQSPASAIHRNLPLVQEFGLRNTRLLYPTTAPQLEEDEFYAWQVIAKKNGADVAHSDIWVFSLEKPIIKEKTKQSNAYPLISTTCSASFYLFEHNIQLGFDNNEGVSELYYRILDLSNGQSTLKNLPTITGLEAGLNTIEIPTSSLALQSDKVYLLEIFTQRGQVYYLKFMTHSTI